WMAAHEYPYLDKPEILDYPTETWPAQDLRKSDVFLFAARYASPAERAVLLERADYFVERSLTSLEGFDTRTTTRPLVLLLSNGFMHAGFDPEARAAGETRAAASFPKRRRFVRQKEAAKQRLVAGAALFAAVGVAGMLALLL